MVPKRACYSFVVLSLTATVIFRIIKFLAAHDQPRPKVTIPAPTTALSAQAPLTPSTPIEKDPFELNDRIPITCRKNNAMFDRRKLGSGLYCDSVQQALSQT